MPDLAGKVALVTGAGGGIGRACVQAFIAAGASVVVVDRDTAAGKATTAQLPPGSPAVFVEADVTDAGSVKVMVATAVDTFGALHIAHNNAGIEATGKSVTEMRGRVCCTIR